MRGRETADVGLAAVVINCRRVQQEPRPEPRMRSGRPISSRRQIPGIACQARTVPVTAGQRKPVSFECFELRGSHALRSESVEVFSCQVGNWLLGLSGAYCLCAAIICIVWQTASQEGKRVPAVNARFLAADRPG